MKTLMMTACALALSSLALAQMTGPADARSRHKSGMAAKSSMSSGNKTGGRMSSPSAAGGNSASPSQPGARGSGGSGGAN